MYELFVSWFVYPSIRLLVNSFTFNSLMRLSVYLYRNQNAPFSISLTNSCTNLANLSFNAKIVIVQLLVLFDCYYDFLLRKKHI